MKKIIATCCVCVCLCNAYADNLITLKCGASFREIPREQCFNDARTKEIDGITYRYRIYKTWIGRSGLYENADRRSLGDKPIGLVIEKAEVPSTVENINVPSLIDKLPVVIIGSGCFKRCSRLKSVALPSKVICISGGAFEGCIALESITLPTRLVEIGGAAFKGCRSLRTKFVFNDDIDLGSDVFRGCHEITSIYFKKGINSYQAPYRTRRDNFNEIRTGTFADCRKLTDLMLPDDIRCIGDEAFSNCCSLACIKLSKSLERIDRRAFADCMGVTEVVIPMRIENILDGAFSGCTALKTVKLPATLEEIPSEMFAGCTSIERIRLPNAVTKLSAYVFKGCVNLKDISIPDHVTEIGVGCFEGCISLQSVKFPSYLDEIKPCAFKSCSSLEVIKLPESITKIWNQAFEDCDKLKSINIPEGVGKMGHHQVGGIGGHAFRGCDSLKSLKLCDGCNADSYAFEGMRGLEEVDMPASIEASQGAYRYGLVNESHHLDFGKYFKDSLNLRRVKIRNMVNPRCPGELKGIGGFRGYKNLESVLLPEGLERIEDSAFKDCSSLSEFAVPESVKYLGQDAFAGCAALKSITLPEGVKGAELAFKGCPAYTPKIDPKEEEERRAKEAREAAVREKVRKEAEARLERERKMKMEAEAADAKAEQMRKKIEEENAKREKELEKAQAKIDAMNREIENRMNKINEDSGDDGGDVGLTFWLFLIVSGSAVGVFVYAKKSGCSYVDAAKQIVEMIRALFLRALERRKNQESELSSLTGNAEERQNMTIKCPHCGAEYGVDKSFEGENCQCSVCNNDFIVSDDSSGVAQTNNVE